MLPNHCVPRKPSGKPTLRSEIWSDCTYFSISVGPLQGFDPSQLWDAVHGRQHGLFLILGPVFVLAVMLADVHSDPSPSLQTLTFT